MSSIIGDRIKVSVFGQSHGEAIGVVIDGLPVGQLIDVEMLAAFMARRSPGTNQVSTKRREPDFVRFVSGLRDEKTCGAPLCALIENTDVQSSDYQVFEDLPRPGHADYPAHFKYAGQNDIRGGGHFSGRLTAPLCIAGGIALQLLAKQNIWVGAHALAVGAIEDMRFDPVHVDREELLLPSQSSFPTLSEEVGAKMLALIEATRAANDSIGGVVECAVIGMPVGVGDPIFGGVENKLSSMIFGIPAVKGIEFGAGFEAARMTGSVHNDAYRAVDGIIKTETNYHGGVLGGLTTGMPIVFRVAIKPTPSIGLLQKTVRLSTGKEEEMTIKGRHDPCIVPRAVPAVEAAAALTLLDMILAEDVAC